MAIKDHYKVLGINIEATDKDVKKAYHSLAKKYHPDKNNEADAEEKFKEIAAAYETLKEAESRRIYNLERKGEEIKTKCEKRQREREQEAKNNASTSGTGGSTTFSFFNGGGPKFTFRSNFSTFSSNADEPKSTRNEKHNTKPPKYTNSRQFRASSKMGRPDWDQDFSSSYKYRAKPDEDDPMFTFSFDFREQDDSPFKHFERNFETFFTGSNRNKDDPLRSTFNEFFGYGSEDQRSRGRARSGKKKPKGDMDDDMWNWSKPMFNKGKNRDDLDYDSDDDYMFRQPCTYCGRSFNPNALKNHETVCKKFYSGSRSSRYDDDDDDDGMPSRSRNWRQEHEDLLRNMKNARAQARNRRESESPPPRTTGDYVTCKYCNRLFHKEAAQMHIAFCTVRTHQNTGMGGAPKPPPRGSSRDAGPKTFNTDEDKAKSSSGQRHKSTFNFEIPSHHPNGVESDEEDYDNTRKASVNGYTSYFNFKFPTESKRASSEGREVPKYSKQSSTNERENGRQTSNNKNSKASESADYSDTRNWRFPEEVDGQYFHSNSFDDGEVPWNYPSESKQKQKPVYRSSAKVFTNGNDESSSQRSSDTNDSKSQNTINEDTAWQSNPLYSSQERKKADNDSWSYNDLYREPVYDIGQSQSSMNLPHQYRPIHLTSKLSSISGSNNPPSTAQEYESADHNYGAPAKPVTTIETGYKIRRASSLERERNRKFEMEKVKETHRKVLEEFDRDDAAPAPPRATYYYTTAESSRPSINIRIHRRADSVRATPPRETRRPDPVRATPTRETRRPDPVRATPTRETRRPDPARATPTRDIPRSYGGSTPVVNLRVHTQGKKPPVATFMYRPGGQPASDFGSSSYSGYSSYDFDAEPNKIPVVGSAYKASIQRRLYSDHDASAFPKSPYAGSSSSYSTYTPISSLYTGSGHIPSHSSTSDYSSSYSSYTSPHRSSSSYSTPCYNSTSYNTPSYNTSVRSTYTPSYSSQSYSGDYSSLPPLSSYRAGRSASAASYRKNPLYSTSINVKC